MIEDIRNSKNLKVYLEQLEEVKARLSFVAVYSNEERDRFVIESHALQIRKLIELIAFSLIAIHRVKYKEYREKVGKDFKNDWNGRDIITNIMSLNPDMFFRASEKDFNLQNDGTKQVHVESPWKQSSKVEQFHNELPSIIRKLSNTLQDHVVLVNHWDNNESTALLFTLGSKDETPTYALSQAQGNFAFESA
jgi:hypothetical protein